MKMTCDLRDQIQRQIYFTGAYEPIEAYLVKHLLSPGMVVIDAGANVGQYTLIAAVEVGIHGGVHAFEPVPKNFQRLAAHVLENGLGSTVRTNMVALWHRGETVKLSLPSDAAGNDGIYTIGIPSVVSDSVACRAVRLDDYVAENKLDRVDFVKMDIEGAEWFALHGATAVISRWRPTMLVEINGVTCRTLGYEPQRIWELLKPYGYLMWAVGQSPHTSRPLSDLDGVERANVIFHTERLPDRVIRGWSYKSVLRFHRSNAGTSAIKRAITCALA
jgi:FkbM family methyltransferase